MAIIAICNNRIALDNVWPNVKNYIQSATEYSGGRHSAEDVYDLLKQDQAQLWVAIGGGKFIGACVSEVRRYPGRGMLNILFCGGRHARTWLESLIAKLKYFARFNDLSGIEMVGRPGWTRVLDKYGFQVEKAVLMELSL